MQNQRCRCSPPAARRPPPAEILRKSVRFVVNDRRSASATRQSAPIGPYAFLVNSQNLLGDDVCWPSCDYRSRSGSTDFSKCGNFLADHPRRLSLA
jgi:hypothetical protein